MEENMSTNDQTKKPGKKKRVRLKKINLNDIQKKLMNILARDTNHLLKLSEPDKLTKDDSLSLVNYLRLLKQLQKDTADDLDNMTDAELEKLANKKS
jgi:hypothetical protein